MTNYYEAPSGRRFLTDEGVEALLSLGPDVLAQLFTPGALDQFGAAIEEAFHLYQEAGVNVKVGIDWKEGDREFMVGRSLRMMLAAVSGGLKFLCPHTFAMRPMIMTCDPPVMFCQQCGPQALANLIDIGPKWENECDSCGATEQFKYDSLIVNGALTMMASICEKCRAEDQAHGAEVGKTDDALPRLVASYVKAGRNEPCPCGSGKKYKRCHGAWHPGSGKTEA